MHTRFLFLFVNLALLANAGPAGARDFLIRPLERPVGVIAFDSGNWIDTDVTPDGRLYVGYAQTVEGTAYQHQVVHVGPDEAVVVDESLGTPFGFVNVDATPSGWLGLGYQAGVRFFPGDLFRTAVPPLWEPFPRILPITNRAATHIAVDRVDVYQQVAYFDSHESETRFADLRWARPGFPEYVSEFVDEVYLRHGRGRQIDIQVDQFDEPRIAYFNSDHGLSYAYRSGSTWVVEKVTVILGQGLGHLDLALDGAGRPHISFYHIDSQDLMYAVRDYDGTWSVELAAFNGRVGRWNSIAIDPAGVPHITAYRATDRNVVLVTPAPGNTWNAEVIDPFGDVGESSSIGIDAYGGIHVVYRGRGNGRPLHAWWMDWNVNGVHDATDIANGLLTDCDGNEIPDEAELLFGFADDCDQDGVIDRCQTDCDGNGINDACQIAADPSADCDGNGTLDTCDITAGALDCDADETLDRCQIAADTSLDCDVNGLLDGCEIVSGDGDCNLDGILDACQSVFVADAQGVSIPFFGTRRVGDLVLGGDLNGDGRSDLIHDEGSRIEIVLGRSGFDGTDDLHLSRNFDSVVVGDVDGDGRDDLIGATDGSSFSAGSLILYRGDTSTILEDPISIDAPTTDIEFGRGLALADVDGDGFQDVIVGSPSAEFGIDDRVYVYSTHPFDAVPEQEWIPDPGSTFAFGQVVVNAGDLDGNGLDDVVVSRPNAGGSNKGAYVYLSHAGGPSERGPTLVRPSDGGGFGVSLAPAGDVNEDGFADVLVGDPYVGGSSHTTGVGSIWLFHGGAAMDGSPDGDLAARVPETALGAALSTSGDLDGDGIADLLVGAERTAGGDRGLVQVYLGGFEAGSEPDLIVGDAEVGGGTGRTGSVAILGDVNDDGVGDFAWGAVNEGSYGKVHVRSLVMPDFADCNGNGVRDACDITAGATDDDLDGIPDTCQQTATSVASSTPGVTRLVGAVPTPFNPRTSIVFELAGPGSVDLTVFDARGRKVDRLVNGSMPAGRHERVWDARDHASGVYFAVLRADDVVARTKLVLLR